MKLRSAAVLVAILAASTSPAFAKEDCDAAFQAQMMKMNIYIPKVPGFVSAEAARKSLDAYNACKAGDGFSLHGVWDQIIADMAAKAGK